MFGNLREFAGQFAGMESRYLGWFVNLDGESFDIGDLTGKAGADSYGTGRDMVFVEPGLVFFIDADGTFDLDRCPDLFALPCTDLGMEMLAQSRAVGLLSDMGDVLQEGYLESLDHMFHADRRCRGERTLPGLTAIVKTVGDDFQAHRDTEKAARRAFTCLLLRFRDGEWGTEIEKPDLSLPEDDGSEEI
jgi:hypothetical protein